MKKIVGFIVSLMVMIIFATVGMAEESVYTIGSLNLICDTYGTSGYSAYGDVRITKNKESDNDDIMAVSLYAGDGSLVGMGFYDVDNMAAGDESEIHIYESAKLPAGKNFVKIKAFILDNPENIEPLSDVAVFNVIEANKLYYGIISGYDDENDIVSLFTTAERRKCVVDFDTVGVSEEIIKNWVADAENGKLLPDKVVEYKLSSQDTVVYIDNINYSAVVKDEVFTPSSNILGNIKMDDKTVVINGINYYNSHTAEIKDLRVNSVEGFMSDMPYTAYAYGELNENNAYPFVIVTSAGVLYDNNTHFAVVTKTPVRGNYYITNEECYILPALYNGEVYERINELAVYPDAEINGAIDILSLKRGDVIMFDNDSDGMINRIDVLVTADELGLGTGYSKVLENTFAGNVKPEAPTGAFNWSEAWTEAEDTEEIDYTKPVTRILYGPVVENGRRYFRLGSIGYAENKKVTNYSGDEITYTGAFTNLDVESGNGGIVDVVINDNTKVYIYDYMKTNTKIQLNVGSTADIYANPWASSMLCNDGGFIPWNGIDGWTADDIQYGTNFALVKMVDGIATDVFVILAE